VGLAAALILRWVVPIAIGCPQIRRSPARRGAADDPAGMTASPVDLPPLTTDEEVLARVRLLVGAAHALQIWIMFVDGDGRQSPVVVPIADIPRPDALARVLRGLRNELTTDHGPGAVIVTRERTGDDAVLATDRGWAAMIVDVCRTAGVALRATLLSTPGGVRWLG
jgi:hypothetical protein